MRLLAVDLRCHFRVTVDDLLTSHLFNSSQAFNDWQAANVLTSRRSETNQALDKPSDVTDTNMWLYLIRINSRNFRFFSYIARAYSGQLFTYVYNGPTNIWTAHSCQLYTDHYVSGRERCTITEHLTSAYGETGEERDHGARVMSIRGGKFPVILRLSQFYRMHFCGLHIIGPWCLPVLRSGVHGWRQRLRDLNCCCHLKMGVAMETIVNKFHESMESSIP